VRWRARTIVQLHGARRATRSQLKRDPLGSNAQVPMSMFSHRLRRCFPCCVAVAAFGVVCPLAAQGTGPSRQGAPATLHLQPALADSLFLSAARPQSRPPWRAADALQVPQRRHMPPELKGAALGMGVGFAAGATYGLYHDLKGCNPLLCGFGPVAYGIYGAGLGVMVGAVAGFVSRFF